MKFAILALMGCRVDGWDPTAACPPYGAAPDAVADFETVLPVENPVNATWWTGDGQVLRAWDCLDPIAWWAGAEPAKLVLVMEYSSLCGTDIPVYREEAPCGDETTLDTLFRDVDGDGVSAVDGDCDDHDPLTGGDLDLDGTSDCVDDDLDGLTEEQGDCDDRDPTWPDGDGDCEDDGVGKVSHDNAWEAVATGAAHSCGLRLDGSIACWGDDSHGQLAAPTGTFVQIAAGANHTCAVRADALVVCWGDDTYGQVSGAPGMVFTRVSAGVAHTCAVRDTLAIVCWGDDAHGQATAPTDLYWNVGAGDGFSCGLRIDDTLSCWGDESSGRTTPPSDGPYSGLTVGKDHACALRDGSEPVCWGDGTWGQTVPPDGVAFASLSAGGGPYLRRDARRRARVLGRRHPRPVHPCPSGRARARRGAQPHLHAARGRVRRVLGRRRGRASHAPLSQVAVATHVATARRDATSGGARPCASAGDPRATTNRRRARARHERPMARSLLAAPPGR